MLAEEVDLHGIGLWAFAFLPARSSNPEGDMKMRRVAVFVVVAVLACLVSAYTVEAKGRGGKGEGDAG